MQWHHGELSASIDVATFNDVTVTLAKVLKALWSSHSLKVLLT